jgi:hypothetical protein
MTIVNTSHYFSANISVVEAVETCYIKEELKTL